MRPRVLRWHAAARCLVAALVVGALSAAPAAASRLTSRSSAARAVVRFANRAARIPAGFEGISFEYSKLRAYARAGAPVDRVLNLIHPEDGQPLLLRVGGQSSDRAWWHTAGPVPRGGLTIRSSWVADLASLTRRDHLTC